MKIPLRIATLTATLGLANGVAAQAPEQDLVAAAVQREECVRQLENKNKKAAEVAAAAADRSYRALIAAHPGDIRPKVGLARLLGQCRMELVGFLSKSDVFDEARALLTQAVRLHSSHWEARFTLGQFYYNAPAFLGHRKDAIREFELLLQHHADQSDHPEMATPYLLLGDLYSREQRQADAIRTWQRGQRLFPDDGRFQRRLEKNASGGKP